MHPVEKLFINNGFFLLRMYSRVVPSWACGFPRVPLHVPVDVSRYIAKNKGALNSTTLYAFAQDKKDEKILDANYSQPYRWNPDTNHETFNVHFMFIC